MAEETVLNYKSRRNSARLVQTPGGRVVRKTLKDQETFQKELEIYSLLQGKDLPCARVLGAENNTLVLSELPGKTLLECLEEQEESGRPQWDVWEKLVAWLIGFQKHTGLVMTDVNLRNFIYDENTKTLYGLDFEECGAGSMMVSAAQVAAFIRTYKPENTPLKQEISQYVLQRFACSCNLDGASLQHQSRRQEEIILQRRKTK